MSEKKNFTVRRNHKIIVVPVGDNQIIISNNDKNYTIEGEDVKRFVIPILITISNSKGVKVDVLCRETFPEDDEEKILDIIKKMLDMGILIEESEKKEKPLIISMLLESNLKNETCEVIKKELSEKKVCIVCNLNLREYVNELSDVYGLTYDIVDEQNILSMLKEDKLLEHDLIYYHTDFENVVIMDALNEFCLKTNIPYIISKCLGFNVEIGPFVIPYQTSCIACMEKRKLSTMNFPLESENIKEYIRMNNINLFSEKKELSHFNNIAINHSFMDIFKYFTKDILWKYPETIENVIHMDFLNSEFQYCKILRNPICLKCSSKSKSDVIERRAWTTKHNYQE